MVDDFRLRDGLIAKTVRTRPGPLAISVSYGDDCTPAVAPFLPMIVQSGTQSGTQFGTLSGNQSIPATPPPYFERKEQMA